MDRSGMANPQFMTDEEVFGGQLGLLSDEEVFNQTTQPKLLSDEEVFSSQRNASPSSSFLPIPSIPEAVAQADVEIGKRIVSGVKGVAETALRGTGAQLTGFQQWTLQRTLDEANTIDADPSQFPFSGYQQLAPEQREGEKNRLRALLIEATLANSSLVQAGKVVEEFGKEQLTPAAGTTKGISGVIGDIAEGGGSLIGNVVAGLALGPASIPLFVAGGAGEAQKRAEQKGATEAQQIGAASFGNFAGATEFADNLLLTMGGTGKALGFISKIGLAATTQGLQEGGQQFIQNLIAKGIYDPTQDVMEDVPYNAFLGAVLGGGVRAATHRLNREGAIPDSGSAPADRNMVNSTVEQIKQPQTITPEEVVRPFDIAAARQFTEGPIWVSRLRDAAEQKLPSIASPEQVLATLTNSPGVKQEEIEATGLRDFLAKSGGRVSKEDVVAHLEENQVKVEEIELTPGTNQPLDQQTQYEEYILPGPREGYRELLLTLPSKQKPIDNRRYIYRDPGTGEESQREGAVRTDNPNYNIKSDQDFVGSHYAELNILANVRSTDRLDHTGANVLMVEEVQSDWHQKGKKEGYINPQTRKSLLSGTQRLGQAEVDQLTKGVPDAPFKTSWPELAFKRMLRFAADNGHDRIAWTTGQQQIDRYGITDAKGQAGMREFYDRIVPSIARKYAKKYGAQVGETKIGTEYVPNVIVAQVMDKSWSITVDGEKTGPNFATQELANEAAERYRRVRDVHRVPYIDVTPKMRSDVREGLPLFALDHGPIELRPTLTAKEHKFYRDAIKMVPIIEKLKTRLKIDPKIRIIIEERADPKFLALLPGDGSGYRGFAQRLTDGTYTLRVNLGAWSHVSPTAVWATMAHELGHIVLWDKYAALPTETKLRMLAAYSRYRDTLQGKDLETLGLRRDNAVVAYYGGLFPGELAQSPILALRPELRKYHAGFDEWFAEQIARWATSEAKPLTLIERTFSQLGRALRQVYEDISNYLPDFSFRPATVFNEWLGSFINESTPLGLEVHSAMDERTQRENQIAIDSVSEGVEAAPQTAVTSRIGNIIRNTGGEVRQELKQQRAYADKINWFYERFIHLFQLGELNRHIEPLQRFIGLRRTADVDEAKIDDAAMKIMKDWRRLRKTQNEATVALMNDITNMTYRTDDEVKRQVVRHPTPEEFAALVKKHRVGEQGQNVFRGVKRFLETFLELNRQNAIKDATRNIRDPQTLAVKIDEINASIESLRNRPYFPFMRFGDHVVVVKDSAGHVIYREHVERSGLMSAQSRQAQLGKELRQRFPEKDGFEVNDKIVLDEQAMTLNGMPAVLLDQIADKTTMSKSQRDALEQLRYELSPAQSFKHRFQHKNYTPGYSEDFQRAFAKYAFYGAKHYVRVKYADDMRQAVADTRAGQETSLNPTKRRDIARYMEDALEKGFLDPKPDFVYLKAGVVLWTLAAVPASALLNLTQTATMTAPFLGAKFGDLKAGAAMTKSIAYWGNFYKKGAYQGQSAAKMRAIDYAIKTGRLDQTLVAELAGFSESSNLGSQTGNFMRRSLHQVMDKGMKMFELAEKMNRRIAFTAAYDLALANPSAKYINEIMPSYAQELQVLRASFNETEARAIVTANHIVEQTQFLQGEAARPRIMRGKLGTLFLYKRFIQGVLFTTLNNKRDVLPRYMVISMLLGGLGGLPGFEDLKELWKLIGWMWGKETSLDKVIREYLREYTQSKWAPEMLLHGISRDSFGVPALRNLMGGSYGGPHIDMSGAMNPGTITPLEIGKLFGPPTKGPQETFGAQAIKAGGAPGSVAFGIYKSMMAKDNWGEFKRWEAAMPRAIRNLSKSYRTYQTGGEKDYTGAKILKYDVYDTGQLAEVIGIALGFQPTVSRLRWDQITAYEETRRVVDLQRTMILKQFYEAKIEDDGKQLDRVKDRIREFNDDLPPDQRLKAITTDTLKRSMQGRNAERVARETETPRRKSDIPIFRKVQELYPGAELIDARRVR